MPKTAPEKSKSPEMQLIVDAMTKNRHVTFAEVRDAAKAKGMTVYPISYGRAQLMLGIVKKKPKKAKAKATVQPTDAPVKRGPGRPRKVEVASVPPARRGPGRPRNAAAAAPGDAVAALAQIAEQMAALRNAMREIARLAKAF